MMSMAPERVDWLMESMSAIESPIRAGTPTMASAIRFPTLLLTTAARGGTGDEPDARSASMLITSAPSASEFRDKISPSATGHTRLVDSTPLVCVLWIQDPRTAPGLVVSVGCASRGGEAA